MVYIELEPDLEACVETKAKRLYQQYLSKLLNKSDEQKLGEKLEILRLFLESTNFSKLRRESEKHLVEGRRVKFIVRSEKGKPEYEMQII